MVYLMMASVVQDLKVNNENDHLNMKFFFKKCTNIKQINLTDLPMYTFLITYGWPFYCMSCTSHISLNIHHMVQIVIGTALYIYC